MYTSEIQGSRRGRPAVRWKHKVKEYMHKRGHDRGGRLEQARRDFLDRERWGSSVVIIPLEDVSRGQEASETIDRYK